MWSLAIIPTVLVVSAFALPEAKEKRDAAVGSRPSYISQDQQYRLSALPKPAYSQVQYLSQSPYKFEQQPQFQSFGQDQEDDGQTTKNVIPQSISSSRAPSYSAASDVSSFTYSSPTVKYNNQGLLQQSIGNAAPQLIQQQQQTKTFSPSPTKIQTVSSPSLSQQRPQYYTSQQPQTFSQQPQTFSQQPQTFTHQQQFATPPRFAYLQQQPQQQIYNPKQVQYEAAEPSQPQQQFAYSSQSGLFAAQPYAQGLQTAQSQSAYSFASPAYSRFSVGSYGR